ncbi:type I secretion system permease/ATPase [Desulfohalobiaceae bacterium Ax17]|uniref:peptidase domain-containing ABC transporter n=1 Tax=Desulfovulcanus ferrireducens TaxID=2831190 RepID=UPI00207BA381|nr:type I secretion system permease/ATPase [Desulfovulcanus ferrireducens]MBT8764286.1 type I secretion system permease/ATPase [Desulfovulcanus ferrireducens]
MNTALISFDVVARINQVDVDIRAIVREFGIDNDETRPEELLRIAKQYGFRAKLKKDISLEKAADKYPLPAIVVCNDNSYVVLLKVNQDKDKVLLFVPAEKKTVEKSFAEFDEVFSGRFIILKNRPLSSQTVFGFKWFLNEIAKFKRIIGEVLLGSFVVQLFGLVTPLFTQVILDKVIVHRSMTTLDVLAVAFGAVMVFELLLNLARNYIFIHTTSKLDAKLGAKLFNHLLALPFRYFEARKVGNIAARVRELDTIREFITNKAVSVIIDLFFSFVFVAVMLLYSVKLTLIVLAFVTIIAILYLTITPELRRRLEEKFQMAAASNSYLIESVTGIQTVKSLAVEGSMRKKWEDRLGKYVNSSFRLANMTNISGTLSRTLQRLMTISVLYIGVKLVMQNDLTIGQLIAFQMFASQFSGPVLRLVNLWNDFQQALLSVDRLGDILNHPLEVTSTKAVTLPRLKGNLRLEGVSFKYSPNGPNVVDKVSFNIDAGTSVGIVGRSGSGKSTIAKLIQRLYIANEGAIYIDGIDIRHMNPVWLRYNIGVVLQENYLFSGTIRENIALARPDASMELIIKCSQLAGAHEFIAQLPKGYDTVVGERGSSLSGGQRQRIAIARALITGPRILIFDEATSALDYESERIIRDNLQAIKKGRTTIIIAHRLSTIKSCDMIIAMDKGRVIETGTRGELLKKKGYYYHLSTMQT